MNRSLPAPTADVVLVLTRVLLGVIMFAHGWQKLVVNGISRTTDGFEKMSIPLAIVSASFVTVVEVAGGILLILGAMTTVVSGLMMVIMTGAAIFVHIPNGIFIKDGGWELVGAIAAGLLALAAMGPGRYSVDRIIEAHRQKEKRALEQVINAPVRTRPAHAAASRSLF